MTGYGRGVASSPAARVTLDIRTVNHRFLDIKLRGAPIGVALEEALLGRIRKSLERGAVAVSIHIGREPTANLQIDRAAASHAHRELTELARALGLPGPDLALVIAQPGVIVTTLGGDEPEPPLIEALDAALVQLDAMRTFEGAALARDLSNRFGQLATIRGDIERLAATVATQLARKLSDRIAALVPSAEPARLAQEAALLADRADITEELVRLGSHLDQATKLVAAADPVGRRLDFLVQELARELNTIGSKAALAEVTALVVEGKSILEKIREQVQNVE